MRCFFDTRLTTVITMACTTTTTCNSGRLLLLCGARINNNIIINNNNRKLCQWVQQFNRKKSNYVRADRKTPTTTATSVLQPFHQFRNILKDFKTISQKLGSISLINEIITSSTTSINTTTTTTAPTTSSTSCWHPCERPEMTLTANARNFATLSTQQPGSLPEYQTDPYHLLEDDLKDVYTYIRQVLRRNTYQDELYEIATYYFDGQGKAIRPMVVILMARAMNYHLYKEKSGLLSSQSEVAMISEMIHTASLVHDDVIDQSDFRRGKPSVNVVWNHKKVAMAGDFILAITSMLIARLRNDEVTLVLSQVVNDLVQGEFMQLGSKETENERFAHYLTKTYRKTASLIANSIKAVTMLAGANEELSEISYQYGRNLGLAFQLVDDLLDFVSSSAQMGKPTAADLKLGLATAPVLFACEKYPELNPMIMRRFQEVGDVEKAFELVHKSQGLEQTQFLAKQHCKEAVRLANLLAESPYQKGLIVAADYVLNRMK